MNFVCGSHPKPLSAACLKNNKMAAEPSESQLGLSWHDSAWIPILNPGNVLEYFSQRTNPFYDRTCNNEVVKMQRLDPSTLQ